MARPTESDTPRPELSTPAPRPAPPDFPPDPLPRIIPGASVNLLAGAPGAGKTALMAWLAVRFRDNLPIFGIQPIVIPKIAIICADRSWYQSTKQWFDLAGFSDICAYSLQDDRSFKKSRLRKKQDRMGILNTCLEHVDPLPRGSILLVDPLALFLGGNINDYDTCAVACSEIRELCQEGGVTIIGTAHAGKQKADRHQRYLRLQDRIAGSVALFGYTDTQLYLAEPCEVAEEFYLFQWHPHHAPAQSFKLQRGEDGLFVPYEGEETSVEVAQDDEKIIDAATIERLLELIPPAPHMIRTAKLIDRADGLYGLSRASLFRYLVELIRMGRIIKVGHGAYCRPPTH